MYQNLDFWTKITIPWNPINVGTNLIVRSSAVIDSLSSISILAHLRNFCLIFFIAHAFGFLPSGWRSGEPVASFGLFVAIRSDFCCSISLYVICTKLFVFLCFFFFVVFAFRDRLDVTFELIETEWIRFNHSLHIIYPIFPWNPMSPHESPPAPFSSKVYFPYIAYKIQSQF